MTVRTELRMSPIHGIGVFAAEPIPAGALVWRLSEWDLRLEDADLARMHPAAVAGIGRHLYQHDGRHVLCFDHARFMNHSQSPNLDCRDPQANYALRAIAVGEELTCDYREFDAAADPFAPVTAGP